MKKIINEIIYEELKDFFENNKVKILRLLEYKTGKNIKINGKRYNQIKYVQDYFMQYLYIKVYAIDFDIGLKVYEVEDDSLLFDEDDEPKYGYKIYGIKYKECLKGHEYII